MIDNRFIHAHQPGAFGKKIDAAVIADTVELSLAEKFERHNRPEEVDDHFRGHGVRTSCRGMLRRAFLASHHTPDMPGYPFLAGYRCRS